MVDDFPDNLTLLTVMLSKEGYEIRRAPNGTLALSNVPRFEPHLILLDILMPDMDGYTVCEHLKANPDTAHIPVIFLSALGDTFDKVKAFRVGGCDHITKPFEVDEVLMRVKQQLKLQELQWELQAQNERLQAEVEERRRAEEKAFQASQAKSDFLARMSHELRTPLSTIIGYGDLLLADEERSATDRQALNAILTSGSHLLTLIEDVLSMTKIESGRVQTDEQIFDFHQFLTDLESMFKLQADTQKIELSIAQDASLPRYIQTDEIKLRQVLINLLSNALKFTQQGFVTVQTHLLDVSPFAQFENASGYLLQFQIQDTGPGIAPEEMHRLFQPFEQTETGRSSKKGSGLGLAISRNFIRILGGEIQVESTLGKGTCFRVEVLVKVPKAEQMAALSPKDSRRRNYPAVPTEKLPWRVLLVLPPGDLQQWLPPLLEQGGIETQVVKNLDDVLEVRRTWNPHLVILGCCLPEEGEVQSVLEALGSPPGDENGAEPPEPAEHPSKHPLILGVCPGDQAWGDGEGAPPQLDGILEPPLQPESVLRQLSTYFGSLESP